MKPRWLVDLHEEFPASALIRDRVQDAIIVTREDVLMGRWPKLEGPLVGYGTMHTMTRLKRVYPDAVFDDYAQLKCSAYYRHIYDLLGRTAVLAPFRALPSVMKLFNGRAFVRSDTNYKLFPAAIVDDPVKWLATYQEHADELAVVAEVVDFAAEYRCFCRDGKFVCGSSYPAEPYQPVPTDVQRFAEDAAHRLGLRMCTIDVATGDRLRVVEIGGVNSWGLYGSDLDAFIAMMESESTDLHLLSTT